MARSRGFDYADRLEAVQLRNASQEVPLYTLPLKLKGRSPSVDKTRLEFPTDTVHYTKPPVERRPIEPKGEGAPAETRGAKGATSVPVSERYFTGTGLAEVTGAGRALDARRLRGRLEGGRVED